MNTDFNNKTRSKLKNSLCKTEDSITSLNDFSFKVNPAATC